MRIVLVLILLALSACARDKTHASFSEAETPGLGSKLSIQMTSKECSSAGGIVVGDIGDGRIYRLDYVCSNGETPLGSIAPSKGEPMPVEGAVCCLT